MKGFLPKISMIYFIAAAILFTVTSCKKFDETEPIQFINPTNEELFQSVGKIFATSFEDKAFKDHLLKSYLDSGIEEFLLIDFLKAKPLSRNSSMYTVLDSLSALNPMLTIAFPSFAFYDEDFQDHLAEIDFTVMLHQPVELSDSLPAYDSNGNLVRISKELNEQYKVCVIKYHESLIAVNTLTNKTYFGDDVPLELLSFDEYATIRNFKLFSNVDLYNAIQIRDGNYIPIDIRGGGGSGGGGSDPCINCNEDCERDCLTGKDYLHSVRFGSEDAVKEFESFWNLPTVELEVVYVIFYNTTATTFNEKKSVHGHWRNMTAHSGN